PEVDVVHTHGPYVYPSYAAAHAAFRHRKPLVYSQRGNFAAESIRFRAAKKRLYIAAVEKPIMKRAASLVALTEVERAAYRALNVRTPIALVPNGTFIPADRPDAPGRVHKRFKIPPDAQLILFLARLHPNKQPDRLMDAFMQVMNEFPRAVLMIAGPDEWEMEKAMRERAGPAGDRVLFPGMIGGEEKADVLARADLFCLPSVAEGFSNAVLEALASSTAVMLSPACNFPEVQDANCGVVVSDDPRAMAASLRALLADPVHLRAMGVAGRRLVADRYSWDVITDRLVDLYREVTATTRAMAS
ncbi:MAG: glycosyltransferase, partial [Thermoanaerobaculia bacterium]